MQVKFSLKYGLHKNLLYWLIIIILHRISMEIDIVFHDNRAIQTHWKLIAL